MTERPQITLFETDALIEALITLSRPLTADERAVAFAVCHYFAAIVIDLQDEMLYLHRRVS